MDEENQPPNQRCFTTGILPLTPLDGGAEPLEKECCESTKKKLSTRTMTVNVRLLDDTIKTFHVQYKASGQVLFDQVCRVLNLLESDYFGLEYCDDQGTRHWLDYEKTMCNQLGMNFEDAFLEFCVKFYTPDPGQLEEEFTRYLYSLQIKRDLAQGRMLVHEDTAAILASYIVQASCGDFSHDDYPDPSYLAHHQFVPRHTGQLERKIMHHHMNHVGQSPSEADMNLLEVARRCEFYGIRLVPAFDSDIVPLTMAVNHIGILVYRNSMKIYTFSWNKIRKLSFKRKKFLIKLHPTEGYGYHGKDCVEFHFDSRNASKSFWKKCIEHHAFFRCTEVRKTCRVRGKTRFFSRGSSFRYTGRTQKQVIEYVKETSARRRSFQRSSSLRLATPIPYQSSGVTSSYSCSSMTHLHGDQQSTTARDNNNEDFSKTTVCLSEPNTPQHRAISSGENIDKDDTISHESYHILNQSLDEPALNTSLPLDTSVRMHDTSRDSDEIISPVHRRAQSKSPEPRPPLKSREKSQPNKELTRQGSIESNDIPYTLHYRRESNPRQKIRRHKSQPREPRSRYRTSPEHQRLSRSSSEKRPKVNFARWGELPPADSYSSRDDSVDGTFESEIRERWTELRRQKERLRARQLWQQRSDIEKSLEAEEALEQLALKKGGASATQPPPHEILEDFNRAQLLGESSAVELHHREPVASQIDEEELGARLEHLEGNLEEIELLKELELEAVQQECQRLEQTLAMNSELKEQYERVLKTEGAEVMSLLQSLSDTTGPENAVSPAVSVSSESLVSPPRLGDDDSQEDDIARKDLPYSEQSTVSERDSLQPLGEYDKNNPSSEHEAFSEQGDDFSALRPTNVPQVDVRDGYAACLKSLLHDPVTATTSAPAGTTNNPVEEVQLQVSREFCAEIEEFLSKIPSTSGGRDIAAEITSSLRSDPTLPTNNQDDLGASSRERQIETTSSGLTFVVESLGSPEKSIPHIPHSSSSSSSSGTPPMGRVFVKIKKKRIFAKHEDISDVSSSSSEIRLTLDEFEFLRREIGKGRKIGQIIPESLISSSEDVTFSDETETVFVGDEPKTLCNSPVSNPHTPVPDPDASLRLSKSSSEDSSIDCANEPHNAAGLNLNIL